jgi:hypothetical protein
MASPAATLGRRLRRVPDAGFWPGRETRDIVWRRRLVSAVPVLASVCLVAALGTLASAANQPSARTVPVTP